MDSDINKISLSLKGENNKLAAAFAGASAGDSVTIGDGFEFMIDEISSDLVIGSIDTDDLGDVKIEDAVSEDGEHEDNPELSLASAPVVSVMGGRS